MSLAASTLTHIRIQSVHEVTAARRRGMEVAREMGFQGADATKIAVVISELARNILVYASEGSITIIRSGASDLRQYIKIIASDNGPGIQELERALSGGYTTSGGLGLGLSGSRRLMDEFSISSTPGQGTIIAALKWLK